MATHSTTLAWKIPWMKEPGRLQSMGSWRVGHNWATSLSIFTFTFNFHFHALEKEMATPIFLPGESQGQRSLMGCCLWGCTELDTTEATWRQRRQQHYHDKWLQASLSTVNFIFYSKFHWYSNNQAAQLFPSTAEFLTWTNSDFLTDPTKETVHQKNSGCFTQPRKTVEITGTRVNYRI